MKSLFVGIALLFLFGCQLDNLVGKPADRETVGSKLLQFKGVYTTTGQDGTLDTYVRLLTHQFNQECQLTERHDLYYSDRSREPYYKERFEFLYTDKGLLASQKQYRAYQFQSERLMAHSTYQYDNQCRLTLHTEFSPSAAVNRYEYIDNQKQINRYYCLPSGDNCWVYPITIDGKRASPFYGQEGYIASSPGPYGNYTVETFDKNGNSILTEVRETLGAKRLSRKVVSLYDTHSHPPLDIRLTDFKGFPIDAYIPDNRNNAVQKDEYTYDISSGNVKMHTRSQSNYMYNVQGYPTRVITEEINMLTGKPTGVRSDISIRYGCGH